MPTERKAGRGPASELGPSGPASPLREGGPPVQDFHPLSGGKRGVLALERAHGPRCGLCSVQAVPAAAQTPQLCRFPPRKPGQTGIPSAPPAPVTPSSLPFDVLLIEI